MPDAWLGRLSRWIEKFNNAKGGPVLVDINHQLQVVIPVLIGNEDRYLQSWNRFGIQVNITGAAGNSAGIELHNPFGSNVIAVLEKLSVRIGPTTLSSFGMTYTSGPAAIADFGPLAASRLDGRTNTGSTCIFSTTTSAVGFANAIWSTAVTGGTESNFIQTQNQELVLTPGSAFIVIDATVAETAAFTVHWRERPLESSELN